MLMYRKMENQYVIDSSDSDFAGCLDSLKSTTGYILMVDYRAISWRSTKKILVVAFSMEVKFVSCFEPTSHGVWSKSFISRLKIIYSISRPLKIFGDNWSAIFMAKSNKSGRRRKHINIKYLSIRERVKDKIMIIEYINIDLMIVACSVIFGKILD